MKEITFEAAMQNLQQDLQEGEPICGSNLLMQYMHSSSMKPSPLV
jgi:hypothetical protein